MLVFEDLHWADDGLLDFVDHLVDWVGRRPAARRRARRGPSCSTRRPGWGGGKRNALTISLSPLADEDTARLLAALLDQAVLPADDAGRRCSRAPAATRSTPRSSRGCCASRGGDAATGSPRRCRGSSPRASTRCSADEKALAPGRGRRREGVLDRRAAALGGDRRRRARASACTRSSARSSSGASARSAVGGRERVRVPARARPRRRLRPDPARRARRKHLAAAEWIESLGRREDHAELLAHHYLQALELTTASGGGTQQLTARARIALRDAGTRAMALSAPAAAVQFLPGCCRPAPRGRPGRPACCSASVRRSSTSASPTRASSSEPRPRLLAAGDLEGAVEAETVLSEHAWMTGRP